jgi:uncharacterized protein YjbJ (UPF0337 family)
MVVALIFLRGVLGSRPLPFNFKGGLAIMGAPNRDELEGKYEQAKGSVKQGLGKVTGDEEMRSEGASDKLKGDVQEGWGGTKRKVGDMLEDMGDAVNR